MKALRLGWVLLVPSLAWAQAQPPTQAGQVQAGQVQAGQNQPPPGRSTPVVQAPRRANAQKPTAQKPIAQGHARPAPAPASPPPIPAPPAPAATPLVPAPPPPQPTQPVLGSDTRKPLPRYMSLNNDPVNMREGPKLTAELIWIYHRRELPVLVERERDGWRLVRDPEGVRGWISAIALSDRRSFSVVGADRTLRARAEDGAPAVAVLRLGVVGRLRGCPAASLWCEAETQGYRGYIRRDEIWGVGPDEAVN